MALPRTATKYLTLTGVDIQRAPWLWRPREEKRYLLHVAGHNSIVTDGPAHRRREAVAGGYGGIFVLLTPTGAMLVARGSGQTAFAAAFLIWE